jgi:hypothetical protein
MADYMDRCVPFGYKYIYCLAKISLTLFLRFSRKAGRI